MHTRICSDFNAALSSPSPHYYTLCDESIIQNSSFRPHSTRWDASVPLFCKFFCVLLGHGCTSCYVFFCPSIPSLVCHLLWLRNQIVGRAFPSTPFLYSTRSHWSSLFSWRRCSFCSACSSTYVLPYRDGSTSGSDRSTQQARRNHKNTRQGTHTHRAAKRSQLSQSGVHYKQPDDTTMYSVQCPSAARLI